MEVIVVGLGVQGIHFLLHEEHLPQIIILNENHLAVGYREVLPSDLVGIFKEIPPNNNEFLIEKLKLPDGDDFVFLLEEFTDQHDFYLETNISSCNQNDYQEYKINRCCSRGPPRAKNIIIYSLPFFILLFNLKIKGLIGDEQVLVINKYKINYKTYKN